MKTGVGSILNYNEQSALKGIIDELAGEYTFIKRIILYGSKARGDFREDSDMDLLFITETPVSRSVKNQMSDLIYDYELENDIVVSAIFVSEPESKLSPFLMRVRREGKVIWSRV